MQAIGYEAAKEAFAAYAGESGRHASFALINGVVSLLPAYIASTHDGWFGAFDRGGY